MRHGDSLIVARGLHTVRCYFLCFVDNSDIMHCIDQYGTIVDVPQEEIISINGEVL